MSKKHAFEKEEVPTKIMSDKERIWLEEEIEVEFYNIEEPGMINKFPYGTTKDYKVYTLFHGGKYKLPRKVIKHLETRQTPIWKFAPDGMGSMIKQMMGWKPRFQCRQVFA